MILLVKFQVSDVVVRSLLKMFLEKSCPSVAVRLLSSLWFRVQTYDWVDTMQTRVSSWWFIIVCLLYFLYCTLSGAQEMQFLYICVMKFYLELTIYICLPQDQVSLRSVFGLIENFVEQAEPKILRLVYHLCLQMYYLPIRLCSILFMSDKYWI